MNKSEKTVSDKPKEKIEAYAFSVLVGELLFTLLPFSVLFLIYAYQSKSASAFLMAPEWAFASAILFGQTIVKFVQGIVESTKRFNPIAERVGLVVAILIVIGLVPSMVILALILVSANPAQWLGFSQIALFCLAALSFVLVGAVAHESACEARADLLKSD